MLKWNPFRKPAPSPLKLSLDTIFEYADKDEAGEVIFQPQRVEQPTEVEGVPAPIVPAGSVVLFVHYKVAGQLEHQLSYDDLGREAMLEQLKQYQRDGWRIAFTQTELGEQAVARRV